MLICSPLLLCLTDVGLITDERLLSHKIKLERRVQSNEQKSNNRYENITGFYTEDEPNLGLERLTPAAPPPGWDTSPYRRLPPSRLSGCPQAICWLPFIHLGGERHCES